MLGINQGAVTRPPDTGPGIVSLFQPSAKTRDIKVKPEFRISSWNKLLVSITAQIAAISQ